MGAENDLVGIDKNFITDSIIGLAVGIGLIVLSSITPWIGVIGIPYIQISVAGTIGKYLIIIVVASIAETIFFQEFVLNFFDEKLKDFGINPNYFVAALLSSTSFALFHFVAYSGSLSAAGGSFLSAGIAGMVFCYERKWTKSLITPMVTHAVINFWIMTSLMVVIA